MFFCLFLFPFFLDDSWPLVCCMHEPYYIFDSKGTMSCKSLFVSLGIIIGGISTINQQSHQPNPKLRNAKKATKIKKSFSQSIMSHITSWVTITKTGRYSQSLSLLILVGRHKRHVLNYRFLGCHLLPTKSKPCPAALQRVYINALFNHVPMLGFVDKIRLSSNRNEIVHNCTWIFWDKTPHLDVSMNLIHPTGPKWWN